MKITLPVILCTLAVGAIVVIGLFSFFKKSNKKSQGNKKQHRDEEFAAKPIKASHSTSSHVNATTSSATSVAVASSSSNQAPEVAVKPKKKSKPKKPKTAKKPVENRFEALSGNISSAAEGDDEPSDDDADSVASDAIIPSKAAQALLKKSKAEAKLAAENKPKLDQEKAQKEKEKEAKKAELEKKKAEEEKKKAEADRKKKEAADKKKKAKAPTPESESPNPANINNDENAHLDVTNASIPHYDGWAVVENTKRKPKKEEGEEENESPVEAPVDEDEDDGPPAPVVEVFTESVTVDAKKLGILIGPKGGTKLAIQNATETTIQMPKTDKETTGDVTIVVSGPKGNVSKAAHALSELASKGYCSLLAADDFQEGYIAVHVRYLPDIIGPKGSVIRALKDHTGVKITVPPTINKAPGPDGRIPKVKIGLAGPKEKVSLTRALIKELTKNYVTEVTHPGQTFVEMDINKNYYNYVIGSKGSEIKHIQNSYKVNVHIPDDSSVNPNIVITGTPENVSAAQKHIEKIIERVDAIAEKAAAEASGRLPVSGGGHSGRSYKSNDSENVPANIDGQDSPSGNNNNHGVNKAVAPPAPGLQLGGNSSWASNNKPSRVPQEEPEEAWTRDFLPPSSIPMDIAAMLPPGAKYSASVPIGPNSGAAASKVASAAAADNNPTPSGIPIEPKVPAAAGAWNNIPGQW